MTTLGARNAKTRAACRAVGYIRRSTDRQEQSIPDQKKAIETYAAEHGLRLGQFYIDDAISGTSTIGRRAFQRMMKEAQSPANPFDLIVVYDVKRFGRVDNDEAGYYRHLLRMHGVDIRYVSKNFNGDASDDLLRPVGEWQARQESKDLSKVTIRGLLSKMRDDTGPGGWWMGGVPPHGYDLRYETADGAFLFVVGYMPDGSAIVNVASDAGRVGSSGEVVYSAAKGGVIAFSKALAREVARRRIRVNAVAPGPTDTPFLESFDDSGKLAEAMARQTPLRRLATPGDVAAAICFLASDEASHITGQVLSVSGGLTMV